MSQEAPTLKWGDIIRIHGVNRVKNKDSKTKGLIVSKGFTDPNIYYQKYDDFQQVNLYRESLFQILPRSNFDIHDQMMQPNLTPHQRQQLKSRASNQILGLENCLHAKQGTQIRYGSEVIFRHAESQSYLRGILKAADIGQGAFKIQVTENLSSQLIFKIKSHRSYEKQNDKIYYDDALEIYHPGADCYMNFVQTDKDQPIFLDLQPKIKQIDPKHPYYQFALARPSIKKPINSRIPIVNENKSKCLWQFIQHCTYQQYNTKDKIKSHDIVYFIHTKQNGQVSSTLAKPTKYYLKEKGKGFYYECFWELIPKQVNEFGPEQCQSFWVKNVVTGQLLTYNEFKIQIQSQNSQNSTNQTESNGLGNGGLINLVCSKPNQNGQTLKLERGRIILVPENVPLIIKQYEKKFQKVEFVAVPKMPKDIFKIYKVGEQTLLNLQYALSSHEPLVKLIQILSAGLVDQFYKEYSDGKQHYTKDQKFDYKSFFLSLKEDHLINIITILKMLIGKIFSTTYDQILSSGNLPDQNMQKILVQTGIVQLVIEIINLLYEPFLEIESQTQPSEDRAIRNKISQIFEYSYRLLEKVAVNNEQNRTYISRWVDLFLKHSNYINQPYIQQTLVGILQNNPASIQATINREKIKELISSFFKEAEQVSADTFLTTKFLRLFSTFIVCENRVILQNQNIILNDFFKNSNNQQIFRVKIDNKSEYQQQTDFMSKVKSKQVLIAFGKQQFTTILKFFRDWTSKWNYFIAYINLLADICLDRNNEAIKNVSALLSLQMVVTILFDPEMTKLNAQIKEANEESISKTGQAKFPVANVHEPFIRIAHYLYVNNDKFDPVKRIRKIRRWYRNEESEGPIIQDINRTKRVFQGEKQQEEKSYLNEILYYILQYLKTATQGPENLSMLYTVLDLLKTTIELGLWSNIQQFRELIPLIIMRITKIDNEKLFEASEETRQRKTPIQYVNMNKELLKMNKPEISKSIQCKIKATQIFRAMNEFQIDIRLRYIMNFFKGLYETTQDFNAYDVPIPDQILQGSTQLDIERNKKAKQEFFKVNNQTILGEGVKKVSEDQQILLKTNVWYSKLKAMTPFNFQPNVDKISNRYLFQGGVLTENNLKSNEQIKEAMNRHFEHIILALLQLPIYYNYRLLNSSLRMLRSIFEQRKQLVNNFKSILICGKGNLQQVYLTLKFMRNKFQMLTNMNISKYNGNEDSSFSYALWKPYDSLVKFQDKRSGIIQDFFFLSRSLKDNISLKNIQSLMRVEEQAFDPNQVYSFFDERQKNNVLFQALNIAEGIYVPLMEYIKIMSNVKFNQEQISTSIHYKLLRSIYQYLTLVCFNNLQAKQQMIQYIPNILPHLSQKVGAASFIYVISNNNKTLISNQDLVNSIIEASLEACTSFNLKNVFANLLSNFGKGQALSPKNYQKSQIFYALRGILLFNNQGHHRNQELLMNKLQDNKYRGLIYQEPIQFKGKLDQFQLSPDQSYVAAHFQMFASLVESGNLINIGKLENIHPYTYCLESLKGTNRWQIRRALRTYVNRLYYVNKQKDVFLFEQFIRKQFDIINNELSDIIILHKNKALTLDLTIKNGIRFKFAVSEIMIFIIQVLITLNQVLLKSEFKKVLSRELSKEEKYAETSRPLHEKLIKLYRHLGCLNKLYPQTRFISSLLKQVSDLMTKILSTLQTKYIQKKAEPQGEIEKLQIDEIGGDTQKKLYVYDYSKSFFRNLTNMIRDIKAKKKLEELKQNFRRRENMGEQTEQQTKKRCLQNIYSVHNQKLKAVHAKRNRNGPAYLNPHLATTSSRTFKVLAKPQLSQNDQNIQLNNQLSLVKKKIEDSPQFQKFRDEEHILFVSILSKLDLTSSRFYADYWQQVEENPTPVISMKQIISVTFNLIVKKPDQIKDEQKIFVVKLIRCYITQAIEQKQDYKLSVDKWDAEYCKEDNDENGLPKNQFSKRQQLIQSCGGSAFIISILSEDLGNRIELLNEVLLLGIAYLFNGNSVCQNSILNQLKADEKNLMLLNVRKLIKRIGDFLIEIRAIKQNDKRRSFGYNIVDTFDYFSIEEHAMLKHFGHNSNDKYQMQLEENNQKAMCRLFRFLQLFCENNNTDMKKFLSVQINSDDNKKTNSANFIEEACLLLRKFFKIMNSKVVNIPSYLLAFLGQITQLPCLDNQISLMKSTFFEDISYLATYFQEMKNKKLRGFNQVANTEEQDNTLNTLLEIYEQGVMLALSNFEGNDPSILGEFINKCQPKYLWIVMRNNIWSLLKDQKKQGSDKSEENPQSMTEIQDGFKAQNNQTKEMLKTFAEFDSNQITRVIEAEKKKSKIFEGKMVMILNILSIIKKLDDYSGTQMQQNKEQAQKALGFRSALIKIAKNQYEHIQTFIQKFEQLMLHVTVSTFNGHQVTNQNLYFPKHPVFSYLSGETKDYIMIQVKRDTRRDKLTDLTKFKESIFSQIQWNYELNYYTIWGKPFPITSDLCETVRTYARNCSYIICVLLMMLVFVDHDTDQMSSRFSFSNIVSEFIVRALCFIQLGLTLLYCYLWGKMRTKLALYKYLQDEEEDTGIYISPYEEAQQQKSAEGWVSILEWLLKIMNRLSDAINSITDYIANSYLWKTIIQPILALQSTEAGFNSLALFVIGSLLGNFYGVEWFSLHIFDYFVNIPLLSNIFKAILSNIRILGTFSMLAGAFILVFNILSFRTYTSVIYDEDLPEQACETIIDCVLQLYTSGAIGDDMDTFEPFRFGFDIMYVVFMELLFQNLVGGIMIDAFSELKDNDASRNQDKSGQCYICSMTRSDMQKNGETFSKHIHNHYLWNYVYYIYCLDRKDETDYTGIQYQIKTQLTSEDISWFPYMGEDDSEGEIKVVIEQLKSKIEGVKAQSESLVEKSITAIKEGTLALKKKQ